MMAGRHVKGNLGMKKEKKAKHAGGTIKDCLIIEEVWIPSRGFLKSRDGIHTH